jgi:hypothetical protein
MSLFSKRNLLVGITTFIIGIATFAAIWGTPKFLKRSSTVKSQVTAYLLDERGAVDGLLLASGDQLHFNPQTGEAVAAQIKIGDEVSATGRAGTGSNYGREVRVEQITANGRTIIEAKAGPKRKHERREPKGPEARPAPVDASAQAKSEPGSAPDGPANADKTENARPAPPEIFKAGGTIKAHLVNGQGEVVGLILSGGEQMRFSPKVGELLIAAGQNAETPLSVEGTVLRSQYGTLIRPALVTVGDRTITLGR